MQIEHISDTARWVAFYRAMETERPDAIFRDPFARRLAGQRGEEFVNGMKRGRSLAWAFVVRTAVFDELILGAIRRRGVDLVLNLAAGLDTRAWRLPVPPSLKWIDADLPGILDYKTEVMRAEQPACHYEAVRVDLTDEPARRALFGRVRAEARSALVVSEGLLIYLSEAQVGALARDLHDVAGAQWWAFDLAHPELLKLMNRTWGRELTQANAPFQFAPASGSQFFEPFGWREAEFHSTMEAARRLHREMRASWMWRILGLVATRRRKEVFRRFSAYVLMDRI